jgi:collagenase-like PrtC family protease
MISKILIYVDDINHIDDYRKAGVSAFLFALEGYSVGYNTYTLEEIEKIEVSNKYVMINRVLDCESVDSLKKVLPKLTNVKGIVYEDIAVLNLIKELNLEVETIFYQNHFGTNTHSVNFWLDRVDSMFISNEITKEEIKNIVDNTSKKVVLHLFGYNQVMYSRRKLLSNWSEFFEIDKKNTNVLTDRATKVKFRAMENEYGTVMYSDKIFNGKELLNIDNVKYYYVNTTLVDHDMVMDFLTNNEHSSDMEDNGFLDRETIYKLKERNK